LAKRRQNAPVKEVDHHNFWLFLEYTYDQVPVSPVGEEEGLCEALKVAHRLEGLAYKRYLESNAVDLQKCESV